MNEVRSLNSQFIQSISDRGNLESLNKARELVQKHPTLDVNQNGKVLRAVLVRNMRESVEFLFSLPEFDPNILIGTPGGQEYPLCYLCSTRLTIDRKILEMFLKNPRIDINQKSNIDPSLNPLKIILKAGCFSYVSLFLKNSHQTLDISGWRELAEQAPTTTDSHPRWKQDAFRLLELYERDVDAAIIEANKI